MNRRDALKGMALSLAAASAGLRSASMDALTAPQRAKRIPPSATDLHVLFHGLWAFWYGQAGPDGSPGVLAFTPNTDHSCWARFKTSSSPFTLTPDVPYAVTMDSKPQYGTPTVQQHKAGMFLYSNPTTQGTPPVTPSLKNASVRSIWLPYPYDVFPIAHVDVSQKPIFASAGDYPQLETYNIWPMMQAFCYEGPATLTLGDGGATTYSEKMNLHLFAQPVSVVCDYGGHAANAFASLTRLLMRSDKNPLDIRMNVPLPMLRATKDSLAGVDDSEVDVSDPCYDKPRNGGMGNRFMMSQDSIVNLMSANPSNCAGGCAIHIFP